MKLAEEVRVVRAGLGEASGSPDTDPITTAVIRHGLNAAADQMMIALRRAAFSPVIYEMVDFACGLYDAEVRMLAQARAVPQFLGTLSFSIEAAVRALGGPEELEPGDIVWSTNGYDNGSHSQDAVIIVPAFYDGALVAYGAVKAHHLDIGAKDPYCTDTTDNFQEGVIFPGVKLYAAGVQQRDMYRTLLANSRLPQALEGDLNAQIGSARTGIRALLRLIERYGLGPFRESVERMYDQGEAVVRSYFEALPDGRYVAESVLDDNGITDDPIPFEVAVEVRGSNVVVDFSNSPPEQEGPVNCPLATTVSTARLAVMALVGGADLPNEGHFRPIEVRTRPGTLFDPLPPAPIFLYGWPADHATELILRAMAPALPDAVPASSGGDICGLLFWGTDTEGRFWTGGMDHSVGPGATSKQDGGSPLMIISCSGIRTTPVEVIESRYPFQVERWELAPDSGGAGRYRGGLGMDAHYRMLADCYATFTMERTKSLPWGLDGGRPGRPNSLIVEYPDGSSSNYGKKTRLPLPRGSLVRCLTGGGGGFGPPSERDPRAVESDLREGYVTDGRAQEDYPELG